MPSHKWTGAPEQWTVSLPYRPSAPRRVGSALLVGAAITGGVVASATTASASPKTKSGGFTTTQSMDNAAKSTVTENAKVNFGGTLKSGEKPLADQEVELQWRTGDGPWHAGPTAKTDENGHATLPANVAGSAQWRISFPGAGFYAGALSSVSVVYTKKPTPPPEPVNKRIVDAAAAQHGKPYKYGATGPGSFDCSGLTQFAHKAVGINLPRTSGAQRGATRSIAKGQAAPGDIIFFANGRSVYHAAVYAGNHKIWTAPDSGDVVKLQEIWTNSYSIGRAW
ncbi:C40 family peptidase [Sciscionella sediminilitoris]|uniref:C40 family peptidase n=1 Tax=Sciscionella sediminilitoris TaxID=1445613 RepID=UPI001E590219|nr:C40 family peptidase [Sciscionella sp. SE31]